MNHVLKTKIIGPGEGRRISVLGNDLRMILTADETGRTIELYEVTAEPGVGVPPHIHTREDEIFCVAEGTVEFLLDGKKVLLEAGATLFGARNVSHGYTVVGDKPCRMHFTVTPGALEPMFDELANPESQDPESIAAICERFGIEFV